MILDEINLNSFERSSRNHFKLNMVQNALGEYWRIPVMVIKGKKPGQTLGITAAIHGNELNGVSIIHELWRTIDPEKLSGTIILIPILNTPGFLQNRREFADGVDLNRIMPGKAEGTSSEVYAHEIAHKLVPHFDYLVDLHTASFGRINSLYIRADLNDPVVARLAALQEPQIIVHKPGEQGTLRSYASQKGIPAITVEVGDAHLFQKKKIRSSIFGLSNILCDLEMMEEALDHEDIEPAVICESSAWIYADAGGIIRVKPHLTDFVKRGEVVAQISNVFGTIIEEIVAPDDGVVVGKNVNPVCQVGTRVLHIGKVWKDYEIKI